MPSRRAALGLRRAFGSPVIRSYHTNRPRLAFDIEFSSRNFEHRYQLRHGPPMVTQPGQHEQIRRLVTLLSQLRQLSSRKYWTVVTTLVFLNCGENASRSVIEK